VTQVAILGSTGMLGSAFTNLMVGNRYKITEFNRTGRPLVSENSAVAFDVTFSDSEIQRVFYKKNFDYVVNAIGAIKQIIDEKDPASVENAYKVNSDFPSFLDSYSKATGTPVIQIGTDCVYSGLKGGYKESDLFDPIDVYGKSKVKGENISTNTMILRCSIIGKEINRSKSILSWLLTQKYGATVNGYVDHYWNGVTTLDFAKITLGIIEKNAFSKGISHLVPADTLNKYQLLVLIANAFGRSDLEIREFKTSNVIDRTLSTDFSIQNQKFWDLGGYEVIPTIHEMIKNYASWVGFDSSKI
jgi:dTDP-4-dehydrorhamnose reductase